MIHPDAIERVVTDLESHPDVAAVFGSYDDSPAGAELHLPVQEPLPPLRPSAGQRRRRHVLGRVRRGPARRLPRDAAGSTRRAIRDPRSRTSSSAIGCAARDTGSCWTRQLQGKHLKRWTFSSMLHADILCRAIPWSQLILASGSMVNDLNLKRSERLCAALVVLALALLLVYARSAWCSAGRAGRDRRRGGGEPQAVSLLARPAGPVVRDPRASLALPLLPLQHRRLRLVLVRRCSGGATRYRHSACTGDAPRPRLGRPGLLQWSHGRAELCFWRGSSSSRASRCVLVSRRRSALLRVVGLHHGRRPLGDARPGAGPVRPCLVHGLDAASHAGADLPGDQLRRVRAVRREHLRRAVLHRGVRQRNVGRWSGCCCGGWPRRRRCCWRWSCWHSIGTSSSSAGSRSPRFP